MLRSGGTSHEALISRQICRSVLRRSVLPAWHAACAWFGQRCDGAQCHPLGVRRQSPPDWAGRLLDSPQSSSAMPRPVCAQRRPHRRAHSSMSHRQHQAGCPPTVQRGSGSSPRWRQRSGVSRSAPSRSPISASPTGSCFVCWSAMERRRPAPGRKGDALGAGASVSWIPVRWDANSCWLIQPRSGPQPAGRGRRETARRRRGPIRRAARREAVPWVHWETRGPPARSLARRGYPNNFQANRPDLRAEGLTGTPIPRRSLAAPPQPWRNGRWW
jgi:hypothetical protein